MFLLGKKIPSLPLAPNTRFLLIRPDKIGDLILTTPAVSSLRKKFPESFISFLCRSYTAPLLENNPDINQILKEDGYPFFGLVQKIKEMEFDVAIHFYMEIRSSLASYLGNIPLRIGPFSKIPSLLLNERMTQNRSQVEKHEADYNLDLVRWCGADGVPTDPKIYLSDEEIKRGKEILSSILLNSANPPLIIHPGSYGSAQNWPLEFFLNLSQKITEEFGEVLFTAGKSEEELVDKIRNSSEGSHPSIHTVQAGQLTLRELTSVISLSRAMISNSTGPLHIAVALGIPTLSFYPKKPVVTSAKRWGPYSEKRVHRVLSPTNDFEQISSISVETALHNLRELLTTKKRVF